MGEQKHTVIVAQCDVQAYLDKGYVHSVKSVEQHIGPQMWGLLQPSDRDGLELMEIPAARHQEMNAPPRRYMVEAGEPAYLPCEYLVITVDVLESIGNQWVVAGRDSDRAPREIGAEELYETPRGAVFAKASHLKHQAARLRAAAANIDEFLRRHEAL